MNITSQTNEMQVPDGATHIDSIGEYWKFEGDKWFTYLSPCDEWKRIINYEPFINEFKVSPL